MENFVSNLKLENPLELVSDFVEANENNFGQRSFETYDKEKFWTLLFKLLDEKDPPSKLLCLKAVRILSRDKFNLSIYITDDRLQKLFTLANIKEDYEGDESSLEALRCLCNLTYNNPPSADSLHSFGATVLLAKKLEGFQKQISNRTLSDIKLLFLITGFSHSSRDALYEEHGFSFFIDFCMRYGHISNEAIVNSCNKKPKINPDEINLLCEILKVAFNVLLNIKDENSEKKEELKKFVSVLREMLLFGLSPSTVSLISNIVNALTSVPLDCLNALLIPGKQINEKKHIEKSPALEAVSILIDFLDVILKKLEEVPGTPKDELSPITLLLTNMSKTNSVFRKYIRCKVLPNLRDVYTRPEVGNTLRNKLCRLLTCPLTSTRDLVADFLFVLCKESVARMVKYTGYGNAAGLFANRGLLGGAPRSGSDSEDSETEEYTQNKHMINPVVGCLTPPRVNEIANMTEEQKEHLALELVNKIDKLQREGIIQACCVGPDGKPKPVDHVLELQESGVLDSTKYK